MVASGTEIYKYKPGNLQLFSFKSVQKCTDQHFSLHISFFDCRCVKPLILFGHDIFYVYGY